jgi:hypothetical protein
MKIIYLLHGKQAFVSNADYRKVSRYRWYMLQSGYVFRRVRRGQKQHARYLHHEIKGVSPGQEVDHKNRIRHDCRRASVELARLHQSPE